MVPFVRELTPPGAGAVSVLEVTGEGALDAVKELSASSSLEPGELRVLRLSEGGDDLDEAICLALDPRRVELHLHGSPVLLERVSRALSGGGRSERSPSGLESEARALLAHAHGERAARILLDQAEGALRGRLEELSALEEVEAREGLADLLHDSLDVVSVLTPPRVVLAGPTNSGKSTLFNALIGSRRAITCAEPGTTRDLVVGFAELDGVVYEFVDTAGEREVQGVSGPGTVERAGQRAARSLRERAEVVLWLERAGEPQKGAPGGCELIETQADRLSDPPRGAVSALSDPLKARVVVSALLRRRLGLGDTPWIPGRAVLFSPGLRTWAEERLACSKAPLMNGLRGLLRGEGPG